MNISYIHTSRKNNYNMLYFTACYSDIDYIPHALLTTTCVVLDHLYEHKLHTYLTHY